MKIIDCCYRVLARNVIVFLALFFGFTAQSSATISKAVKHKADWFETMVNSTFEIPHYVDSVLTDRGEMMKGDYRPQDRHWRPVSEGNLVRKAYAKLEQKLLANYNNSPQGVVLEVKSKFFKGAPLISDYQELKLHYMKSSSPYFRSYIAAIPIGKKPLESLREIREIFALSAQCEDVKAEVNKINCNAMRLALSDREKTDPSFKQKKQYLNQISQFENERNVLLEQLTKGDKTALEKSMDYVQSFNNVLLSNPVLADLDILMIQRKVDNARTRITNNLGFPSLNSHNNTRINNITGKWRNDIVRLSGVNDKGTFETVYAPKDKVLVTDLDLHFDANKLLFSSTDENFRWHVYQSEISGEAIKQITPKEAYDVDHFDACYLPNGDVAFTSSATFQGLPCEGGSRPMSLVYILDTKTNKIRQITYEQDSDWCPTVMNNGKLLYLRWEYSDLPHYFSRILMTCNPDGTAQKAYYGSSSYFPNTFMFARPIPNDPTKLVGIVGGHHGITRSGRLMILDPMKGRAEADGVVQEIPYRNRKVEPIIKDRLIDGVWPQFLHPYPLNDKYFLVSAKMTENDLWGIYLVDVFDNMTLVKEVEGSALFDPIPIKKQKTPPIIPAKVNLEDKEATVFISNIYEGEGLVGIPKGAVKSLRLFSYHFAHIQTGGHASVGVESSWDVKRIIGTVPVEEDGSAMFKVPANTPISIQPLDENGAALQIMRSWFVGMPGEVVSCVGCHEDQNMVPPNHMASAARKGPKTIEKWYGEARPFSFRYEVQPILDKYCVSCHNPSKEKIMNFTRSEQPNYEGKQKSEALFLNDEAYMNLHPYIRRPGPESDLHVLKPMEYHASTSELVQMLQRGHHNVQLDKESWDKLYAWIDLNVPYRGKWSPPEFLKGEQQDRRMYYQNLYAMVNIDPEVEFDRVIKSEEGKRFEAVIPMRLESVVESKPKIKNWPFTTDEAKQKQAESGKLPVLISLSENHDVELAMVPVPKGKFVKATTDVNSKSVSYDVADIKKDFYMSRFEVTNEVFQLFDQEHDSRFIDQQWKDHTTPGYPANHPKQPVIRVTQEQALAFCDWLSSKTGHSFTLPTEDQWEWACRAGSDQSTHFDNSKGYSSYENLADNEMRKFAVRGVNPSFIGDRDGRLEQYGFIPRDRMEDDGNMVTATVGSYKPNAWGLYDMQGNVAEWTLDNYKKGADLANQFYSTDMKVVRGGSWRDRLKRAEINERRFYPAYQKVYNVGFRVVMVD